MARCEVCGLHITLLQRKLAGPSLDGQWYDPAIHYACRGKVPEWRLECGHLVSNFDDTCRTCVNARKAGTAKAYRQAMPQYRSAAKGPTDKDLIVPARGQEWGQWTAEG